MQFSIPYGRQDISEADIQAVVAVLQSDYLTQGPAIEQFEAAVAKYCGVKYAVAVSSATAALHIACLALGLQSGDRLWTSPNTFVASANCGLYCGATIDFVDIDPKTYILSVSALQEKLAKAKQSGEPLPKVVVPVHFAGQSAPMKEIHALAQQYGFALIEDASHCIGGTYQQKPIGSCEFSGMTVFSFHPVKIITTAEGGMITTNREDLYQALLRLRSHGITRNEALMSQPSEGGWYYEQLELGYNYRITDIQAALGVSQMQRLDAFVTKRRELAARYNQMLADLPLILPYQDPAGQSAYHLYPIQILNSPQKKDRRAVFDALRAKGILVNVHYIPVHRQPYYQQLGFNAGDFPQAEAYYARAISLPLYAGLTHEQQDYIVETLWSLLL